MDYSELDTQELQRELENAQTRQAELALLLKKRREETKHEFAQEIKDQIIERGYDIDEIAALLMPKKRKGKTASAIVGARSYPRYADPDNPEQVYTRGVLPGWMKKKMQEQGLDPASKDDRETFKSKSLRLLAD